MSKISDSARMEDCLIRIPGVCNRDPETTVLCHENGGGWSMKYPDSEAAYGCSSCHDEVDSRTHYKHDGHRVYTDDEVALMFYQGQRRTRIKLIEKELIKLS